MRRLALVLLVASVAGCNDPVTPTAPSSVSGATVSSVQSSCGPTIARRTFTVQLPDLATPVTVWLESVTPGAGATMRVGDSYSVVHRQVTPPGVTVAVQFQVGDDGDARRSFTVLSAGGCGVGTFRSQVLPTRGAAELRVRIWVSRDGALPPTPQSAPVVEATEPLGWVVVP